MGRKTERSNQAANAQARSPWKCRREKLMTKSASATAETALQIHPGSPASAISATTQSQYCGEYTLLAMKKKQISAHDALSASRRRVRSSTAASASAVPSVAKAEMEFAAETNPRGSLPASR